MLHSAVSVALVFSTLLGLSTRASAACAACGNCVDDYLPSGLASCLDYWTCSGETITCYYPSGSNPGTYTACTYVYDGTSFFDLTPDSPSICIVQYLEGTGNPKCEPPNDPFSYGIMACTAAEGYVGES